MGRKRVKQSKWNNITIKQYNLINDLRGELKEKMDEIDNININIKLYSIISGKDIEEIERMDINEFGEIVENEMAVMLEPIPTVAVKNKYEINGKQYALNTNVRQLSVSQYIDYNNIMQNEEKDMVKLLSIYLIPDGKEYGDYDFGEVYKDIESMSVVDGNAICFFFRLQYALLMRSSIIYSKKILKKMMKREKNEEKKKKMKETLTTLEMNLEEFGAGGIL